MKKINILSIIFTISILVFISCERLDVENNKRVYVVGTVVDLEGNPLSGISINTQSRNFVVANTTSDANGNFEMTSLEDKNFPLSVIVNARSFSTGNDNGNFSTKIYYSQFNNKFDSYTLGNVVLAPAATLDFRINNISDSENILRYSVRYVLDVCEVNLDAGGFDGDCDVFDGFEEFLNSDSANVQTFYNSIQGTTVFFEYQLNDQPFETIEIPLTNTQNTYVFEF